MKPTKEQTIASDSFFRRLCLQSINPHPTKAGMPRNIAKYVRRDKPA
jgi:hypothetical protein